MNLPGRFWLVGCGNMAGAMIARWLDQGIQRSLVTVIRPSGAAVGEGVRVVRTLPEGKAPAFAMLGIKPQKLDEVAPDLAPLLDSDTILVSLLAGVEFASLRARFPAPRTIVRAMPNTPVRIGKGVTNLVGAGDDADLALVESLMRPLGHVEWFADETLFQAASMLSGAGPAFLFRFIDAMAAAGAEMGLDEDQAARLARAMVAGAAALATASDDSPAELADKVASPGGTTRAGLNVLDGDERLRRLMIDTLAAGIKRSREMAAEARAHAS